MKKYKVNYFLGDKAEPISKIREILPNGTEHGSRVVFCYFPLKRYTQYFNFGKWHGLLKEWRRGLKNWVFVNWRKGNEQGIQIDFDK